MPASPRGSVWLVISRIWRSRGPRSHPRVLHASCRMLCVACFVASSLARQAEYLLGLRSPGNASIFDKGGGVLAWVAAGRLGGYLSAPSMPHPHDRDVDGQEAFTSLVETVGRRRPGRGPPMFCHDGQDSNDWGSVRLTLREPRQGQTSSEPLQRLDNPLPGYKIRHPIMPCPRANTGVHVGGKSRGDRPHRA